MTNLPIDLPRLTRCGAGRVSAPEIRHHTGSAYLDELAARRERIWKRFMARRESALPMINMALLPDAYIAPEAPPSPPRTPEEKTPEERATEAETFCWEIFIYRGPSAPKPPKIARIQAEVAKHFDIRVIDILSMRRTTDVVVPRQIAMYLSRTLTLRSLPEIGRQFNGRDHTTVMHAVQKITFLMKKDAALAEDIMILREALES